MAQMSSGMSGGSYGGGMSGASGHPLHASAAYSTPSASLGGAGGGSKVSYFHLSDLNMPVQIKMSGARTTSRQKRRNRWQQLSPVDTSAD